MTQEHGGQDSDGKGSGGMIDEKPETRPADAGETGTTRFGIEDDDTDDEESDGMVRPQRAENQDEARAEDLKG